jgi:hypothetical protein
MRIFDATAGSTGGGVMIGRAGLTATAVACESGAYGDKA